MKYPEYSYVYMQNDEELFYIDHMPDSNEMITPDPCIYPDGTKPLPNEKIKGLKEQLQLSHVMKRK